MRLRVWIAGVACLMGTNLGTAEDDKTGALKGDPRAITLMEEAARTRYTWSQQVTGVSGKFTWHNEGKSGAGTFHSTLRQRGGTTFTAEGGGEVPEEVKDHIGSLIGHRVPPAPAAAKRPIPPSVIVVEDEDHGPLIMTLGDPMQSTQRVKDGRMVQVNRLMGGKRFTIDVVEFEKSSDGRFCPTAFNVTWWEPATGKKTEKQSYTTQGLELVDGQMFPKAEKVVSEKDGKTTTLEIQYSNIKFEMSAQKAGRN
jgi:Protein of unknown function (DUF3386)